MSSAEVEVDGPAFIFHYCLEEFVFDLVELEAFYPFDFPAEFLVGVVPLIIGLPADVYRVAGESDDAHSFL